MTALVIINGINWVEICVFTLS